jgi:hypothetical protein
MNEINNVCAPCGISANVLTCLKRFRDRPSKLCFTVSTYHIAECDFCGKKTSVTEVRDFFYPDFELLVEAKNLKKPRT